MSGSYNADLINLLEMAIIEIFLLRETFLLSRAYLNKRYTHEVLELYRDSTPLYSYALLISNMNFKSIQQPSKRNLVKNSNKIANISEVYSVLCKDWIQRETDAWVFNEKRDVKVGEIANKNLERLFNGKQNSGRFRYMSAENEGELENLKINTSAVYKRGSSYILAEMHPKKVPKEILIRGLVFSLTARV